MGYADLDSCMLQLSLSPNDPADAADVALLMDCDALVSVAFEAKAGYDVTLSPIWRGVTATVTPTTRTVWGEVGLSDVLVLPVAARSITNVQIAGEYPQTLTTADWLAWNTNGAGASLAIRRLNGYVWPLRWTETYVSVTALWADGPRAEDPPAIVVAACTVLAVDEFRSRKTSPSGEMGPDGLTIRPQNPWRYETVKQAIEAVRATEPALVF